MRLTAISLILTVVLAVFATGCSRKPAEQPPPDETEKITPPAEAGQKTLLDPETMNETAPEKFLAKFVTSKGDFTIEVTRAWAPNGADRFYNLVNNGYYDDCRFFRVIENFMVQFGINGDPALNQVWSQARLRDDPVMESNQRNYVSFAMTTLPHSRTTQIFINYKNNSSLDLQRFAPFGRVIEGMNVVDSLYSEYGETPTAKQPEIQAGGNAYLSKEFPKLDHIKTASIVPTM